MRASRTEILIHGVFIYMDLASRGNDIYQLLNHQSGKHWSLVQARPRNEKFSMQNLAAQGLIVYLPLITKVEIHNRAKRERHLPMFPGYFFACPSLEQETIIRRDKCVWNLKVLYNYEEDALINDLKIVRECELLSREHKLVVNPRLKAGDTVRLKNGPFKYYDVIVVKRCDESRVIVNLNFFNRHIELYCTADDLIY